MKFDTSGIATESLIATLRDAYGLPVASLRFMPKGEDLFGYIAQADDRREYFVKAHVTTDPGGLAAALDVAWHLHHDCGLRQVIAPYRTVAGRPTFRHERYTVALFDLIGATPLIDLGYITEGLATEDVAPTAALIAAVHASAPTFAAPPRLADPLGIPFAARLDRALAAPDTFGEPTNAYQRDVLDLLAREHADVGATLRRVLAIRDAARSARYDEVLTHGDPTAGNILKDRQGRFFLIDWGAATLGPPERDLVFFAGPRFADCLATYAAAFRLPTLHRSLFAFYLYLWVLQEIADYSVRILDEDRDPAASAYHWAELQPYLPIRHREIGQATDQIDAAVRQVLGARYCAP
jgi:spectinomycin phosphotransferase